MRGDGRLHAVPPTSVGGWGKDLKVLKRHTHPFRREGDTDPGVVGEGAGGKNTFWWCQEGKSLDWVRRDHHTVGRGKAVETGRDHLRQRHLRR